MNFWSSRKRPTSIVLLHSRSRELIISEEREVNDSRRLEMFQEIYQASDAVFHHQMKHWQESWKYSAARCIIDELRGVLSGDETLASNAWYYFSNKIILEGEIKDAKLNSFSSDFQPLIKH